MVDNKRQRSQQRSKPTKSVAKNARPTVKATKEPSSFVLGENTKAFVVLGLSVASLGLSIYGITGGHLERYAASNADTTTVYASTPSEVAGTADSAERQTLRENGNNSGAGLNGDGGQDIAQHDPDTYVDKDAEQSITNVDEAVEQRQREADELAKENARLKAESEAKEKEAADAKIKEEQAKKMESMRLRIKPDRDSGDIYYYIVETGDQLSDLAEKFNVPIGQLMESNYIEDANHIYVGEVIFMPVNFAI